MSEECTWQLTSASLSHLENKPVHKPGQFAQWDWLVSTREHDQMPSQSEVRQFFLEHHFCVRILEFTLCAGWSGWRTALVGSHCVKSHRGWRGDVETLSLQTCVWLFHAQFDVCTRRFLECFLVNVWNCSGFPCLTLRKAIMHQSYNWNSSIFLLGWIRFWIGRQTEKWSICYLK